MQIKDIIIESKIQNKSKLFAAVGNQEFVAFLTFFIRMNFAFNHPLTNFLNLKTFKQIEHSFLNNNNTEKFPF